jgi:hypothetical protein
MPQLETHLPARRPELVSCRLEQNGRYLVRNRATGESFQLGEEEHFLLSALDGRQTGEEIRAAFQRQVGEPLTEEDIDEFIELSTERGLLQDCDSQTNDSAVDPGPLEQTSGTPVSASARPNVWKRAAIRLLNGCAAVLRWSVWLPNVVTGWIHQRVRHLEFTPRSDDVFIVTYPRSGTTWLQMILYQLTTDGEINFPHVAEFCPWFERSVCSARGFELRPSPRLFKSHLSYSRTPKGPGKYIYVAREGKDVALSYYHLYCRYNGYEGTFDEFFELFLKGKTSFGCWFQHVKGWWQYRDAPNVLFLTYEQLKSDFDGSLRQIADFCGWEISPEKLSRVRQRSSFAFMKQHEQKFDPALETLWEQGVKLKSFLRNGCVGEGAMTLTEEQSAQFEKTYADRLGKLGIEWP